MSTHLEAVRGLANELSSALADIVEAVKDGHSNTSEISATLAEMLKLARAAKPPGEVHPVFNVPPATVTVMPAPVIERIDHEYDTKGRLVRSVPVYRGS